jgi:site-specific DNA-methyltransferase (adenine-specific)
LISLVPKKAKPAKRRAFYKSPPPKPPEGVTGGGCRVTGKAKQVGRESPRAENNIGHSISPAHFSLREDGSIGAPNSDSARSTSSLQHADSEIGAPPSTPSLIYASDTPFVRLYCGNCLELLDAIAAKYPDGRFDAIFADPPYFLSNGGITCHAGKMVKVDKGDWDVSRGPELNHEFNTEWLRRCQRVLKPNGTIWVTGTHHVIFSIGYAMQQLGYKILNDIAWEKPNPPPNLSCRYFTHSTETVLWAAKNDKSKHVFNYQEMRKVTGKQMKTVWRDVASDECRVTREEGASEITSPVTRHLSPIWTITAPGNDEKQHGKHPTQKPTALIERCLLASTNEGDLVLDPFLGNGTTAVASVRLKRGCVGVELDLHHVEMAVKRVKAATTETDDLFSSQAGKRGC